MKKYALAIALFIPVYVVLVICCTPSLHPIYTDEDVVFYPELLGVWVDVEEAGITLEFTQLEDNAYRLKLTDEGDLPGSFIAHLVSIGDLLYMDIYPEQPDMETSGIYLYHTLPIHSFTRIDSIEPELIISSIDQDWLDQYLQENPDVIANEIYTDAWGSDRILLTAPTEEIQAWLIENADELQMEDDPLVLAKVTEEDTTAKE